jgi:hypothetical protein
MPIGVATYTTSPRLPKDYKKLLPDSKAISEKIEEFFEDGVSDQKAFPNLPVPYAKP